MFHRVWSWSKGLSLPLRGILILWLGFALAVAGRTILRPDSHTVFPVLAEGAAHWWADEPVYANYRPALDYFRYPPTLALFVTPFELLGHRWGGVLWSWLNLAVLAWGLWRFRQDVLPGSWSANRQALFLALATAGSLRSLWNAQSNALAVGLLLLGTSALVRQRFWPAAALLGSSVFVKLTPLPAVMLLMIMWPRQLIGRIAFVLILGAAFPFFTRPAAAVMEQYGGMAEQMRTTAGERWPGFRDAWTMWLVAAGLFEHTDAPLPLLQPLHSEAYRGVQLLTAAAALAWCLILKKRGESAQWLANVTLAAGAAWTLLFGHAVEHPTYIFLAPSLAWALLEPGFRHGRKLILTSAVLILILGWGALTQPWHKALPLLLAVLPIGTCLFASWLIGFAWRREPRLV